MKFVLILGANSGMARALALRMAGPEVQLILAGRHTSDLEATAADLAIRCKTPKPRVAAFDALDTRSHAPFVAELLKAVPHLDEVYLFFGVMHDQREAQSDFRLAQEMMLANYVGAVSILEQVAIPMEKRRQGIIAAVSSVAGDRGRQSNYFYGSSKAGLTVYLQGLRNRLARSGVHVLTVKPGFVDTAMTRHLKKGLLFAKPDAIAQGVLAAVRGRKNEVYLPFFWRWIMAVIKAIPEGVFKKMKL